MKDKQALLGISWSIDDDNINDIYSLIYIRGYSCGGFGGLLFTTQLYSLQNASDRDKSYVSKQ